MNTVLLKRIPACPIYRLTPADTIYWLVEKVQTATRSAFYSANNKMATMWKSIFRTFVIKPSNSFRYLSKLSANKSNRHIPFSAIFVASGTVAIYTAYQCTKSQSVLAYQNKSVSRFNRNILLIFKWKLYYS